MTEARIGIIGTGWWATDTHIPALLAHPKARLVALCDSDPARLQAAADRYGQGENGQGEKEGANNSTDTVGVYTDVHQMLAEATLDGVIVVSSNATHYAVTKACLQAGVHVMLEKPMTLHAAEAQELVELSAQAGKELIIGYPFNFAPYAVRARAVIAGGELGAIQYVDLIYSSFMTPLFTGEGFAGRAFNVHGPDQYTKPALLGGGHGQVQITHGAGLLFYVTGLQPQRVSALMRNHGLAVDLINVMTVQFGQDAVGTAGGSGNYRGLVFRLLVGCENGWIDIDAQKGVGLIHHDGHTEEIRYDAQAAAHPLPYATAHNLVDVITGDATNGSSAEVGWRAVELLEAAYRSANQDGAFVDVSDLYR
ncbi:MAG: Gfo/Idh/MocA family oxidoreductase [Litorilinea sp.]